MKPEFRNPALPAPKSDLTCHLFDNDPRQWHYGGPFLIGGLRCKSYGGDSGDNNRRPWHQKAWNKNMAAIFTSGWITCLDESMSIWTNKWTCPGWIFSPSKPRPIVNEYHYICCGLCVIMFAIDLVEGNTRPKELLSYPRTKKATNLLFRL